MVERLSDFALADGIFADANIFDYHHANHPRFGSDCTGFLRKIENGLVHAATSNVVE